MLAYPGRPEKRLSNGCSITFLYLLLISQTIDESHPISVPRDIKVAN